MNGMVVGLALVGGVLLVGLGVLFELRARAPGVPAFPTSAEIAAAGQPRGVGAWVRRLRAAVDRHPAPGYGLIETLAWLAVLVTLVDHLSSPREGTTAFIAWVLTIGPHEIGHVICMPFGWLLHVAGGSINQVLWWALPAMYVFWVRRQITVSLLLWAVAGHSLINLAPYIGDARSRDLPLLFGMDASHHDWWNLLSRYDLLAYDHTLALLVTMAGAGTVVLAAGLGLVTTWALPRTGLVRGQRRFEGPFWRALRAALQPGPAS